MKTRFRFGRPFFLIFLVTVASLNAQEILQDATALVKPELFSHLSAREEKALGMIRNAGPGTVTVTNTRNGTVSEIILIQVPDGISLQPNTLYLNTRAADSIGLSGKSCFVDISEPGRSGKDSLVQLEEDVIEDTAADEAVSEEVEVEDSVITEPLDDVLVEESVDIVEEDPVYGNGTVMGFDELSEETSEETGVAEIEDSGKNETLADSNLSVGETVAEETITEDNLIEETLTEETFVEETPFGEELAEEETFDVVTDDFTPVEVTETEEVIDSGETVIEEEMVMTDEDIIYFLEPSDFRPPGTENVTVSSHAVVLPPLKEGSELESGTSDQPVRETANETFLQRGFYVQVGIYADKKSLEGARGVMNSLEYPQMEFQGKSKSGKPQTKLLLGPFKKDEIGVVLYKVRHSGYSDAFIVEIFR